MLMENKRIIWRNFIQLICSLFFVFFTSCSSDNDNSATTISLDEFLAPEYQNIISKYMSLNKGSTPPNIEGLYYMNTPIIVFDSDGDDELDVDHATISLKNQSSANTVSFMLTEFVDMDNDIFEQHVTPSDLCYISGSGNKFTLYFKFYEEYKDMGINCTEIIVISGVKTSLGLSNLSCAAIMIDKNDPNNDYYFGEIGDIRIMAEKDGLASN